MSKKKTVVRRKGIGTTHTYHGPRGQRKVNVLIRFLQKVPSWGWWIGGAAVVAGYVWFFYYFFVGPFGFRWRALYGDVSYPEGYEIHGIDISHHQGRIDWGELKDNGSINKCPIRFVMIKATEGATQTDENFRDNFYQARENGFTRGAYHFYSVHTPAEQQACRKIGARGLRSIMEDVMMDVMYRIPSDETIGRCTITKEAVEGTGTPRITYREGGTVSGGEKTAETPVKSLIKRKHA